MTFDIEKVLSDMANAGWGVLQKDYPGVQVCVTKAISKEKLLLLNIAQARFNGDIDDEDVATQLQRWQLPVQDALLACQVQAKKAAQDAVNAAIQVFNEAVYRVAGSI